MPSQNFKIAISQIPAERTKICIRFFLRARELFSIFLRKRKKIGALFIERETRTGLPDGTYIFKTKKSPSWVNFGGSCNGRGWYIPLPFGLLCGQLMFYHLVYFVVLWYIFNNFGMSYLKNLATLNEERRANIPTMSKTTKNRKPYCVKVRKTMADIIAGMPQNNPT
jgi:hypothetical protein